MYDEGQRQILLIVFILYFVFLIGQGLYFFKKTKTSEDFVVAGRSIPLFPLILSVLGTAVGGSSLLGFMAEGYKRGISGIWGLMPAYIVIPLFILFFAKAVRNVGEKHALMTIPDFTAFRFGEKIRLPAAICILFAYSAITGLQYIAIGTFLKLTLGWSISIGIIVGWLLLTTKTHFGGLKAVIWSDSIQGTIQALGVIFLAVFVYFSAGGWGNVVANAIEAGKPGFTDIFSMSFKDLMMFVLTIGAYQILRQDQWQRVWAGKTGTTAWQAQWAAWVMGVITTIMVVGIGTMAFMGLGIKTDAPQLIYYHIVMQKLPFWAATILIVAVMATVVSCADSFLVAGSASVGNDLIKPNIKRELSETENLKIDRYSLWTTSLIALFMALAIPKLVMLWVTGSAMLVSGLLVPVIAGFYWKRTSDKGALVACWSGLIIAVCWQVLGNPFGWHPVFVGLPVSTALLIIVSLMTEQSTSNRVEDTYYFNHNSLERNKDVVPD